MSKTPSSLEKSNPSQNLNAMMPPVVLSFAGSDPTCGAGIQADMLALAAIGCHPATVITAITVQDTVGVSEIHGLSPEVVVNQAEAILQDMPVSAFKLGLLGGADCVRALGDLLEEYDDIPLIFDPVLASGAGDDFVNDEILEAIFETLIPQTTILTPNVDEARRLVAYIDKTDANALTLEQCAERLTYHGCEYVLLTGTHANTKDVENVLYQHEKGEIQRLSWPRLPQVYHGSGCTLASAIAGYLASGMDIPTAVRMAQSFTWQSLRKGYRLGMGRTIPNRFFWRPEPFGVVFDPQRYLQHDDIAMAQMAQLANPEHINADLQPPNGVTATYPGH